ncbi:MAG: hypothetical protein HYZ74_01165, partial [Elusimicrobia bacterium]|nr:hypothetical protein [Elusimicrobiota bacterium]
FNPFPWLAGALVPIAAVIVFIQRKLANATQAGAAPPASGGAAPVKGGYGGLLLGVIAAAFLLSFASLIPGLAGAIASLGVLGKFAAHLGVALALPLAGWFIDRAIRAYVGPKA